MEKRDLIKEQNNLRIFKVRNLQKIKKLKRNYKLPIDVYIEKIASMGGFKIFLVDGYRIRQFIDLDFTMGGHGLRYIYVPLNEIWIDSQNKNEKKDIILHEIMEFKLMQKGVNYNRAHEQASLAEQERRNEKIVLPVGHHLQVTGWSCGPSALKIVLDYYKDKRKITEIIKGTNCNKEGTLHKGFRKFLRKLGYRFYEKKNSKTKDLEEFIQRGIPVIVDYQDYHFYHGGHFSVVIGYDKSRVIMSNPVIKKKYEWISKKDFEKRWWEEDEPGKIVNRWMLAIYRKKS